MKYLIDLIAMMLMGDGMAKILSGKAHNRFYQHPAAPGIYNGFLHRLSKRPGINMSLGIMMMVAGAMLSRRIERKGGI